MIKRSKCGCIARVKKQNEIIAAINPLLKLEIVEGTELGVHYSDNNVVLTIPAGGYDAYVWEELELDVCIDDVVTTKTFLVKI